MTKIDFVDSKPHYELLDGLRGVAALLVICYHIFEGFAFASGGMIETLNHGYLAVDFFFILSGFVISYAYDDRWKSSLTTRSFFARRLIRLHPMVIMGAIIGTISFCIGGCQQWDGTHITTSAIMLALLCAMFLIPAISGHSSYEVRGNGEMFPLNGPCWSLFFEYIGNILYALFIRKLTTKALSFLVAILALIHIWFATANVSQYGSIGVGWTLDTVNFWGGMLRMMLPFTIGMLIARTFKPINIRGAFWICAAILFALFSVPYLNEFNGIHINGIFESLCVIVIFPLLVWIGASSSTTDRKSSAICHFLGEISYPAYIVHYPIMYLFYQWLIENKLYTLADTWVVALSVVIFSIILAYICLKCYDIPVRRFLSKRILTK
jgi:peptidoglycan/LPS O-acetylase OafA/YrhL